MEGLEKFYPGDTSWNKFAEYYSDKLDKIKLYEKLVKELGGHKDLAIVIIGIFEDERSLKWIHSKSKILGGVTPKECINNDKLIIRLRTSLMRFPV